MHQYLRTSSVLGAGVAFVLFTLPASAAEIKPSHVFQSTENIKAELNAMHEANFSSAKSAKLNLTPRKPRHVFQKAREVYLKIQKLKEAKGGKVNTLEPFPVRAVKPQDVKGLVDKSLTELQSLRGAFGAKTPKPAAFVDGKSPTDVYANLTHVAASIDGLGIPKTVPNDVYQVALTIISDLNKIRTKKGVTKEIVQPPAAKGKKPKHVYQEALMLIEKLKKLTEKADYKIPGGVVPLNKVSGRITPSVVLDALNNALAEAGAIKQVIGVTSPTEIAAKQSGKTPSDVFMAVKKAQAIVDSLL